MLFLVFHRRLGFILLGRTIVLEIWEQEKRILNLKYGILVMSSRLSLARFSTAQTEDFADEIALQ